MDSYVIICILISIKTNQMNTNIYNKNYNS